jgi:hypothetical protein
VKEGDDDEAVKSVTIDGEVLVIESKQNGLQYYAKKSKKKFLFLEWEEEESREQIVIRLAKEYLEKQ